MNHWIEVMTDARPTGLLIWTKAEAYYYNAAFGGDCAAETKIISTHMAPNTCSNREELRQIRTPNLDKEILLK